MPSGHVLSSQCCFAPRHFRRFRSISYATKFHQNLNAICITKASDRDPSQQLNEVSFLLSPLPIASNYECARATSLQLVSLVEELNKHQEAVLRCVQRAVHFGLITEILSIWCL